MAAIKKGFLAFCSQDPSNLTNHHSIGIIDNTPSERKEILSQTRTSQFLPSKVSILRTNNSKRPRSKRKVRFAGTISQRAFSLFQCHEMVVPSAGAYPLGLGEFLEEYSSPVRDHCADMKDGETKSRKYPCGDKRYLLPKIPETERIKRFKKSRGFSGQRRSDGM